MNFPHCVLPVGISLCNSCLYEKRRNQGMCRHEWMRVCKYARVCEKVAFVKIALFCQIGVAASYWLME